MSKKEIIFWFKEYVKSIKEMCEIVKALETVGKDHIKSNKDDVGLYIINLSRKLSENCGNNLSSVVKFVNEANRRIDGIILQKIKDDINKTQ